MSDYSSAIEVRISCLQAEIQRLDDETVRRREEIEQRQQRLAQIENEKKATRDKLELLQGIVAEVTGSSAILLDDQPSQQEPQTAPPSPGLDNGVASGRKKPGEATKLSQVLDVLSSFGRKGARPRDLKQRCLDQNIHVSSGWVNSALSQLRKRGLVLYLDGYYAASEVAGDTVGEDAESEASPAAPEHAL